MILSCDLQFLARPPRPDSIALPFYRSSDLPRCLHTQSHPKFSRFKKGLASPRIVSVGCFRLALSGFVAVQFRGSTPLVRRGGGHGGRYLIADKKVTLRRRSIVMRTRSDTSEHEIQTLPSFKLRRVCAAQQGLVTVGQVEASLILGAKWSAFSACLSQSSARTRHCLSVARYFLDFHRTALTLGTEGHRYATLLADKNITQEQVPRFPCVAMRFPCVAMVSAGPLVKGGRPLRRLGG